MKNMSPITGYKQTRSHRKKLSLANIGKHSFKFTRLHKKKIGLALIGNQNARKKNKKSKQRILSK